MLEIGKRKLKKAFTVVRVPVKEAYRIFPNDTPEFAIKSKTYGCSGYGYCLGEGVVAYCGYDKIGKELTKDEIDKLALYYELLSVEEAKVKVKRKILDKVWGWGL